MQPVPSVYADGQGVVGAAALNGFVQGCLNLAALRTVVGNTTMTVFLQGYVSAGDGGQGMFYWSPTSTAPDNSTTIVRPYGVSIGAWVFLPSR